MLNDIYAGISSLRTLKADDVRRLNLARTKLDELQAAITLREQALLLCQRCLDEQADGKKFIEALITSLLQAVAGPEFIYHLLDKTDELGNIVGFQPMVEENGVVDFPRRQGGGIQNLVSFGHLLCNCFFLHKRLGTALFMLMDEHMLNLDADRWPKFIRWLQDLQRDIPFQWGTITHVPFEGTQNIQFIKTGLLSRVRVEAA